VGELGLTENAVNIALHHLARHGVVERVSRGRYRVKAALVALALLDRVERLEMRRHEKRGAGAKPSPALRSTSTTSDRPEAGGGP